MSYHRGSLVRDKEGREGIVYKVLDNGDCHVYFGEAYEWIVGEYKIYRSLFSKLKNGNDETNWLCALTDYEEMMGGRDHEGSQ